MDTQHKRRGLFKGKMLPFSRASKPASSSVQYTSRTRPNHSYSPAPSITYLVDHQDMKPQPRQKVSFLVSDEYNSVNALESYFGTVGDEYVNMKATVYISSVKDRFKLDQINSERIHDQ